MGLANHRAVFYYCVSAGVTMKSSEVEPKVGPNV